MKHSAAVEVFKLLLNSESFVVRSW